MRRERLVVVVVALGAIAVVAGALSMTHQGDRISRDGSTLLPTGQPVAIDSVPSAYRIDYRRQERVSGGVRTSTVRVEVRRPFESRVETRDDGTRVSLEVARLGRSSTSRPNAATSIIDEPPALASGDLRVERSLRNKRERRRVLGQVCQVYRTGERLSSGVVTAPTKAAYIDSCVDRRGLLLEELRVAKGKRDLRSIATRVNTSPRLTDAMFAMGQPTLDVAHGGGATRRADPSSSPPGQFWQLDALPPGFGLVGRFVVVPPQPETVSNPLQAGSMQAAVTDVFRRGADAVFIERGGTLHGDAPWSSNVNNTAIDLGALGKGEIVLSTRGAEVRALTGGGHYVRVFGTLPVDDLATIARQLHAAPGTEIKLLD